MHKLIDQLGNWNPQLFRELKGRFTPRNMAIAVGVSAAIQFLTYLCYLSLLPDANGINLYSRYCVHPASHCFWKDGAVDLNWQLWNFDVFIGLSILGMGILLIIGSHLINADLAKEEKRGTLGFVRLSPQPVQRIILGKLLGVPSLIYLGIAAALPFHLIVGLKAGISLPWIGMMDLLAIAACVTFFSVAALWSFVGQEFFGEFQTWLYSGVVSLYLFWMTIVTFDEGFSSHSAWAWLRLIYPGNVFYYLVENNSLGWEKINYFWPYTWFAIPWFGVQMWHSSLIGLGFIFLHYAFISLGAWLGLKRRFYDPQTPMISKPMGYGIAIFVTVLMTGFAYRNLDFDNNGYAVRINFEILQIFYCFLFIGLAILMTPTRQRIQDWQRFRHQGLFSPRLWSDLLWGDRSPALGAIALSLIITTGFMGFVVMTSPVLQEKMLVLGGLILQMGTLLILASLVQLVFLKRQKRNIWLVGTLASLSVIPFLVFAMFRGQSTAAIAFGLFSFFPLTTIEETVSGLILWIIAAQWLAIAACTFVLQKQIRRLGDSELKTLLTPSLESP